MRTSTGLRWLARAGVVLLLGRVAYEVVGPPGVATDRPVPVVVEGRVASLWDDLEGVPPEQGSGPILLALCHDLIRSKDVRGLPTEDSTPEELAANRQYLESNRALLPRLREAGRRPGVGLTYDFGGYCEVRRRVMEAAGDEKQATWCGTWLANHRATSQWRKVTGCMDDPFQFHIYGVAHVLELAARESMELDRPWDALEDLETQFLLGCQFSRRCSVFEQGWGSQEQRWAQLDFRRLVLERVDEWGPAALERLANSPLVQPERRCFARAMEGPWQRTLVCITIEFGAYGGYPPRQLADLRPHDVLLFLHAGREACLQVMSARHEYLLGLEDVPPCDREEYATDPEGDPTRGPLGGVHFAKVKDLLPTEYYRWALEGCEEEAEGRDVSRTVVALVRYKREHGDWPARLDELVPAYLDRIPVGAKSWSPVRYRRTPEGPLLYGLGEDGVDDGGDAKADRVFLPVDLRPH